MKRLSLLKPDRDERGWPMKHERHIPAELAGPMLGKLDAEQPLIEQRYGTTVVGEPHLLFQQYWDNDRAPAEGMGAEGWKYMRKKWTKVKSVDLVGFIWLKDYHDSVPLDPQFEVYGGKLEFPAFNFSLVPTRGTLVLFPATPHFVTATSHVLLGTLEQVKVTMQFEPGWQYDPAKFPGTYTDWLVTS